MVDPILPDHPTSARSNMATMTREEHRAYHLRGDRPLLPDHHADAALNGWEPFESRRHPAEWNRWDMVGAIIAVLGAVLMAGLL